jgi:mannose-1-phosphate guanylyltransferase
MIPSEGTIVGMYAVILAGGGGTRLWPLSRTRKPKPFLPLLAGGRCLLEATVSRLSPMLEPADIYVVTDADHARLVREAVPAIPPRNIIAEPMGRNTAAAVAVAGHLIERAPDDVMISLHADHAIADEAGFRALLEAAVARARGGDIVTLGIEPTEAATGYGYILATGEPVVHAGRETFRVERFEEKPAPARAQALLDSGRAYWNAGQFAWRRDALLAGLARHAPDVSDPIAAWAQHHGRAGASADGVWPAEAIRDVYEALPARAIDYALLEPASAEQQVAVVPAAIGWSDLGSWSALREHRSDSGASVITAEPPARVIDIDGRDVLVHAGGGRTVAVVGLSGVIVVDTPDALLVSSVEAAQDVKRVVDQLRAEGREDLL